MVYKGSDSRNYEAMRSARVCLFLTVLTACGASSRPATGARQPVVRPGVTIAEQSATCASTGGYNCVLLANRYDTGNGVLRDEAKALELFTRACDGGHAAGCTHAARGLPTGPDHEPTLGPYSKDAAILFKKGCELGDPMACMTLDGFREPADTSPAPRDLVVQMKKGCEAREVEPCMMLGAEILQLQTQGGSAARASDMRAFLTKQCALKNGPACAPLGDLAADQRMPGGSHKEAERLHQMACALDVATSCAALVKLYMPKPEALSVAVRLCAMDESEGCKAAAWLSKDAAVSDSFSSRSCALADPTACFDLATLFSSVSNHSRDEARALSLFQTGCDLGDAHACREVGAAYQHGRGAAVDLARAASALERACMRYGNDARSVANAGSTCRVAAELWAPHSAEKQRALLAKSCESGLETPCADLKKIYKSSGLVGPLAEPLFATLRGACERKKLAAACDLIADAIKEQIIVNKHLPAVQWARTWREGACEARGDKVCARAKTK